MKPVQLSGSASPAAQSPTSMNNSEIINNQHHTSSCCACDSTTSCQLSEVKRTGPSTARLSWRCRMAPSAFRCRASPPLICSALFHSALLCSALFSLFLYTKIMPRCLDSKMDLAGFPSLMVSGLGPGVVFLSCRASPSPKVPLKKIVRCRLIKMGA